MTDTVSDFINAACVPLSAHSSGSLNAAESILAAHPEIATANIVTAAILGDDAAVREFIAHDGSLAVTKSGPRDWDPLVYLCFSQYLKFDANRSDGFVRAATALLDAGAGANTGWFEKSHQPEPEWESVIYGAAGVAHHAPLTRLLLERGANPNDGETPYHAAETFDNAALQVLLYSGKLNEQSLATLLLRKTDWHDYDGIKMLLDSGINPNLETHWGKTALHNAALSDNHIEIFKLLLDHGANPLLIAGNPDRGRSNLISKSVVQIVAHRGRGDVLNLFRERGFSIELSGGEALLAACALDDKDAIQRDISAEPGIVDAVIANGGAILGMFAGNGNDRGVERLLDLGVPVDALWQEGDGYFGIARNSTALHAASWRARHSVVKLLLWRGARVDARDGKDQTPLQLAIRAGTDSYWKERRTTESIEALLSAGASPGDVQTPTDWSDADSLLSQYWA